MRKITVLALILSVAFASCTKSSGTNCGTVQVAAPASELEALRTYISTNSITATEDPRGFFYSISTPGSGNKPTVCNAVTVNYSGKLTNGTVFDSGNNVQFNLSGLIIGWQEGIPLIAPGGSITLYLPPSLAYGSTAVGSIPANSILVFTIDLLAVN
ncbi:MAG TPA: FKBP-type peptidyl-prolyl cis-trans isomerase [Panacibacter sp.]|nr:FKBP-type peptidyl-prolyl cis-trans isomerase [Panacibacter sp.]HNP42853.1 FKBP-type peptidyl-prolyl cis-trans isomerase [Panacibacter sp.]